jgi:branched-chain amino acid transport system permease protein
MVMLGGVNSTPGAFVGAVLVTMMPEWLRPVQRYLKLLYGIGVILLMIFMPMGLAGLANMVLRKNFGTKRDREEAPGKGGEA